MSPDSYFDTNIFAVYIGPRANSFTRKGHLLAINKSHLISRRDGKLRNGDINSLQLHLGLQFKKWKASRMKLSKHHQINFDRTNLLNLVNQKKTDALIQNISFEFFKLTGTLC